jgi:Ni/Fe-hydrogenase subunit HybB-like protein
MDREKANRLIKDILWVVLIAGGVLGVLRFAFGLGASTAMLDSMPWGWWKIFNMVAGAALATSGFVVAAIIYIFKADRYKKVARLSVLVGFLGYGSSLVALGFDVGLPHRGWHPVFMWNPHSFLFEVFWCVSLYWSITALELIPLVTERFPLKKFTHLMHEVMLPFVVIGVTLSTMHHSSLGSLFMAAPTRLHPLWHSMWIPPEFLISAMGGGLATICLVYLGVTWLTGRGRDMYVLSGLAKWSAILLGTFAVVRVIDLTVHGKWNYVFGPDITWETYVFAVEFTLQAIIPVLIFATPAGRRSVQGLAVGGTSALIGLTMHRLDTGITGFVTSSQEIYLPMMSELLVSGAILSAVGLAFLVLVERFNILEEPGEKRGDGVALTPVWSRGEAEAYFKPEMIRAAKIALLVAPITVFAFQGRGASPYQPVEQEVYTSILSGDEMRAELRIDADRDGDFVLFPHLKHQQWFEDRKGMEAEETCVECHHLSVPEDENSACRTCHADMELTTPMFVMARHEERFEEKEDREKFLSYDLDDPEQNFMACFDCHDESMEGLASYAAKGFTHEAPGFRDAMHGNCLTCHRKQEEEGEDADAMSLGNCHGCHDWAETVAAMDRKPDASQLWRDGRDLYLDGRLEQAEALYRQALELEPSSPAVLYQLGVLYRVTGRDGEAAAAFRQAAMNKDHKDAVRAREALDRLEAELPVPEEAEPELGVVE